MSEEDAARSVWKVDPLTAVSIIWGRQDALQGIRKPRALCAVRVL